MSNMTNIEIYDILKLQLDQAEIMQDQMHKMTKAQDDFVDILNYNVSQVHSMLTEEELSELETF